MHRHFDEPHSFAFDTATRHYAADRPVVPTHVRIDISLDFVRRGLSGTCTTRVQAVRDLHEVTFDAKELDIERVMVDGRLAKHSADGERLRITLPARLNAGASADVRVDYRCTPRRGLYFVGPDAQYKKRPLQAWTQGQDEDSRSWFPCLDAPAQKATSEVIATFPKKMTALSNGRLVSDTVKGERRTMHYRLEQPHSPYLVTLAVGEFDEHVVRRGPVSVRTLYPKGQKANAMRCVERTPQMLSFFEELTGEKYPWGDYAQVFVSEFIFGGMENTGATTLTDAVLHDEKAHADYSAEPLISHELAHQWFGDLLTCRDWPHGWLNEGFATYSEVLWKERADSHDEADHQRKLDLDAYLEEAGERYVRPIVERKFDQPIELFDRHLYEKGGLTLHALRHELGDDDFFKAVRHYVRAHRGGAVETVDLQRSISDATGKNLDRFFDEWVFRAGHPALKVSCSYDSDKKLVRLEVKQTQSGDAYRLPLDVQVVVAGERLNHRFVLETGSAVFTTSVSGEPEQCVVDGRRHLLATLEIDKPQAWWRHELTAGFCARARTEAAVALGKDGSAQAIAALAEALRDEREFWATRAACAAALAKTRAPAAKAALLQAMAIKHPKARRAVFAALGAFHHDGEVAAALAKKCRAGDASYFVQAEAARSLGKTRATGALPVLAALLRRPSFQDVVAIGALDGLAELDDPKGFELAVAATKYGALPFARRAAVSAVARLAESAQAKHRAVDVISELFVDPMFRVRQAAIDAAQHLGDERLIGPLQAAPFLDGREVRAAKEAVRAMRTKAGAPKELAALRNELDALKGQLRALEQRLGGPQARTASKAKKKRSR